MNAKTSGFESKLKIGAVARLTGLSVHTLRKWEQRYGAVEPERTEGGGRLYSRDDVKRLALIRRLTQAGTPLREIASATLDELEQAARSVGGAPLAVSGGARSIRLAIAGDALPVLFGSPGAAGKGIEVVASGDTIAAISSRAREKGVDLVVLELATVQAGSAEGVRGAMHECRARGAIVVYGFGSALTLDVLRRAGVALMRAPVDPGALQSVARGLMQDLGDPFVPMVPEGGIESSFATVPPPRFSGEAIARVARTSPSVRCECPRHLADLVLSLGAFERYSAECESANPRDAALHHYLWETAGRCRAIFEEALAHIAEVEGIDLEQEGS